MTRRQIVAARVTALVLFPVACWTAAITLAVWLYRLFLTLT